MPGMRIDRERPGTTKTIKALQIISFLLLPLHITTGCEKGGALPPHLEYSMAPEGPAMVVHTTSGNFSFHVKGCVWRKGNQLPECDNTSIRLDVTPDSEKFASSATLSITYTNTSTKPVKVKCFLVEFNPSTSLEITRMFHDGYQSWSPAFVWNGQWESPPSEDIWSNSGENPNDPVVNPYVSWWDGGFESLSFAVIAGALRSHVFKTRVLLHPGGSVKIVNGCSEGDAKSLFPGETLSSDILAVVVAESIEAGLKTYGTLLGKFNTRPSAPFIPVGWNSWNTFFSSITAGLILQQAEALKTLVEDIPLVIQIDDGWEKAWGEWKGDPSFLKPFFTAMSEMAQKLIDQGFIPGIWIAPFLYDESLPGATSHPHWFLKNPDGSFVRYLNPGSGKTYLVLDITHPEAENFLRSVIRELRHWGFRYLKLDFLFAAAMPGIRYKPYMTSIEAYRRGIEIIAEEAGPDTYLLACGAPLLPSAGLFHGARVGSDIAFEAMPYGWPFVKNEMRNVFWRFHWNRVFAGDPDTVLLRDLSAEEARTFINAALLAGKIFALGDDLVQMETEKKELLKRIFSTEIFKALVTQRTSFPIPSIEKDHQKPGGAPADILTQLFMPSRYSVPSIVWSTIGPGSTIVGIFNWTDAPSTISFDLRRTGACTDSCTAVEAWTGLSQKSPILRVQLLPRVSQLWVVVDE